MRCESLVWRSDTASNRHSNDSRGSVERHFDDERPPGLDVADLPPQWLLPGQPRGSPRASGERPVELELRGRIVPVLDVGSPVPRERGTHRDVGLATFILLSNKFAG